MEFIQQKDKWGCVIACFAMLTNKSYDEVKGLARTYIVPGGGVFMESIPYVARILNYKTKGVIGGKKKDLKTTCMVFHQIDGHYHALVWDHKNKRWLDPLGECSPIKRVKISRFLAPDQ